MSRYKKNSGKGSKVKNTLRFDSLWIKVESLKSHPGKMRFKSNFETQL